MSELQQKIPIVDWHQFLLQAFKIINHELEPSVRVMVDQQYLMAVSGLVTELLENQENESILTNYLIWRLIATFYPSKYRDDERRGEQCLKQTEDVFGPVKTFKYFSEIKYFLLRLLLRCT